MQRHLLPSRLLCTRPCGLHTADSSALPCSPLAAQERHFRSRAHGLARLSGARQRACTSQREPVAGLALRHNDVTMSRHPAQQRHLTPGTRARTACMTSTWSNLHNAVTLHKSVPLPAQIRTPLRTSKSPCSAQKRHLEHKDVTLPGWRAQRCHLAACKFLMHKGFFAP
jgi:hypothetical protein